ncbi:hypothetical protein FAM09_11900 [Niastella caeni]|uniref:T9SS C-terminal target domain-containing protein n=1 Tax=Niastella caeni TaxID=2569763 RepID=A0A4S8HVJ3_9BACT|nr:hypothetical protein [Niastella caeni]THU39211.1 hypothetical protein FAM09_11900 [Niastella caeni]
MKRLILSVAVLAVAATACKKNGIDKGFSPRSTFAGPYVDTVVLPLTITADRFLAKDTLYVLDGKCYVTNNATLILQEGTHVEAVKKSTNDSASALIVTRGAQLFAAGTPEDPIVFTSHQASPATGDWGGIVLLGNAPLNRADATVEGINLPSVPAGVDVNYGGGGAGLGDVDHSAGQLEYVRIEYAGASIAQDNELNGLTCGGVGAGTVLNHIEVAYGNDDAFEFFGGTVNAYYLFALAPDDDAFDFDFGYRGHIQYALSVLDAGENYSANPNGIESDNNATGATDEPRTKAIISNMTVIGVETSSQAASLGLLNGAQFRRHSSYEVRNSIFMGFPTGLALASAGSQADFANYSYNLVHGFNAVINPATITLPVSNGQYVSSNANTNIQLADPFNGDFRPLATSPALSLGTNYTGLPSDFEVQSYRGAFGAFVSGDATANNWLAGWTRLNY